MEPSALVYDTAAAAEVWRRVAPAIPAYGAGVCPAGATCPLPRRETDGEAALGSDVLGSRAYAEELADREAEEAAAHAAEADAMEAPEPELDEYGIAIEGDDQETTSAQNAAEAKIAERMAQLWKEKYQ